MVQSEGIVHLVGLKVMAAESETVGHTVSVVGEQTEVKAGAYFSSFSLVEGPSS